MSQIDTIPGIPVAHVNHIEVNWAGEHEFDAARPGGPAMRIDARARTGPSPVDAFLAGLASCTSVDVIEILAKRRTPISSMKVEVDAARADAVPRRVIGILLTYHISGAGIEVEHAKRAIELSVTRYCSVRDSVDPNMPVRWKLILDGTPVD